MPTSSGEAPPSRWRRWFASTGAAPAWGLVGYMACGLVAGAALGGALPHVRGTMLSALAGIVVAAAGSGGPSGISRRAAVMAAGWGLLLTFVGFATGGHPVWAALAMAAVALLTSVAAAAGPLGAVLGFLLSLAYMLVATLSRVASIQDFVPLRWAAAHIAVGCLGGLLVVFVGTALRRRSEPDDVRAARVPLPVGAIWASIRNFDEHARDGVRRAVPLAILMYLFQLDGGRDAFWAFFAAYLVLLTPGKNTKSLALARVGTTLFGVLLLAVASIAVPDRVLFSFGIVILFGGIGLAPPYPLIGGGLTTIGSVLMAGAPTGAVGNWAERRLVDTIVGAPWPSPRPTCSGRETKRPRNRSPSRRPPDLRGRRGPSTYDIAGRIALGDRVGDRDRGGAETGQLSLVTDAGESGSAHFERILCGVDGTPASLVAVRQAVRLQAEDGSIVLSAVANLAKAVHAGMAAAHAAALLEHEAEAALAEARAIAPSATTRLVDGDPATALLQHAESEHATTIAVGSHGRGRTAGLVLGTVAARTLRDARCSVLIARPARDPEAWPQAIVVGVDGSEESAGAAAAARSVAARFGGAARAVASTRDQLDADAARSIAADLEVANGGAVRLLVDASRSADLVVVGNRGLHGLKALGSVSERVAHQARCSVLVVWPLRGR